MDTPQVYGFAMPAEWEPHAATWIAWPHNADDWPDRFGPIPWVFAEIVRYLHRGERVCILVNDEVHEQGAAALLRRIGVDGSRVTFYRVATDRVWTRDYGPIFVKDAAGTVAATKWHFNAWAKYDNWHQDDAAAWPIIQALGLPYWQPTWNGRPIVLEGGSIEVNGQGTLLTTEECLLSAQQQRNPGLSRHDLEQVFARYLGIRKVLWLRRGIAGDDTHGHIDDLARFVNSTTVVTVVEDDRGDANHEPLQENLELLRGMTDQDGRPFQVATLPMPAPLSCDGQRLPASYANFYLANQCVLVPTFNDPHDRLALTRLAELFPGRQVVGIYCGDLIWGLGAIHCMTQQQPGEGIRD
jgi:agmatine deiminase